MKVIALLLLALIVSTPVQAATYYFDPAGNDSTGNGSSGNPWKSWNKALALLSNGTFVGDDQIYFRAGRYLPTGVYPSVSGGGGTAGHPVKFSVDPAGPAGDVEIVGATVAGGPGATTWVQAGKCTSGVASGTSTSAVGVPCDTNADCGDSSTPTCTIQPNIFWSTAPGIQESTGVTAGVVYQPGATPGSDPKIFEIVYSDPQVPITMPTFTQGHDQVWSYSGTPFLPSQGQNLCTAANTPWFCCTGVGTGCSGKGNRVYVQVASSTVGTPIAPGANTGGFSSVSPPVEIPVSILGDITGANYVTITNNNNGRIFHFLWSPTAILTFRDTHDWTVEDFDIGYNTRIWPHLLSQPWLTTQSAFPRNSAGPMYLVYLTPSSGRQYNMTFRRGIVHHSAGDEGFHGSSPTTTTGACTTVADCTSSVGFPLLCTPSNTCLYSRNDHATFDTVEFANIPWAVLNGSAANSASIAQSWPPSNYPSWNGIYGTHYSPLGGGGQSPGPWIMQGPFNHFNHVYVHDCGSPQLEQDNHLDWGDLVENSLFDGDMEYYGAAAGSVLHPTAIVTQCDGGPAGASCGGFGGDRWISFGQTFLYAGVPGNSWVNNIFINMWNQAFWGDYTSSGTGNAPAANTSIIANNYFALKGNGVYVPGSLNQITLGTNWNGIWENNIVVQQTAPAGSGASIAFPATNGPNAVIDKNFYGLGTFWKAGATLYSAFATYKTAVSPNDANSVQNTVSIDGSYCLNAGSPGIDAGTNLSSLGVTTDYYGTSRPQGLAYDMGPCEVTASGTTTSTTSTTTTTLNGATTTTTTLPQTVCGVTIGTGSSRK